MRKTQKNNTCSIKLEQNSTATIAVGNNLRAKLKCIFHPNKMRLKSALLGSVAFSFSILTSLSPAISAEFGLLNGDTLTGEIQQSTQNDLIIQTSEGAITITRAELETITIASEDGELITGSLRYWFNGVYELQTDRGSIRSLDGVLIADNREPIPEPEPIEEKPLTEEEQRALIMAIFSSPVIDTDGSDPIIALMRVPTSPEAVESLDISNELTISSVTIQPDVNQTFKQPLSSAPKVTAIFNNANINETAADVEVISQMALPSLPKRAKSQNIISSISPNEGVNITQISSPQPTAVRVSTLSTVEFGITDISNSSFLTPEAPTPAQTPGRVSTHKRIASLGTASDEFQPVEAPNIALKPTTPQIKTNVRYTTTTVPSETSPTIDDFPSNTIAAPRIGVAAAVSNGALGAENANVDSHSLAVLAPSVPTASNTLTSDISLSATPEEIGISPENAHSDNDSKLNAPNRTAKAPVSPGGLLGIMTPALPSAPDNGLNKIDTPQTNQRQAVLAQPSIGSAISVEESNTQTDQSVGISPTKNTSGSSPSFGGLLGSFTLGGTTPTEQTQPETVPAENLEEPKAEVTIPVVEAPTETENASPAPKTSGGFGSALSKLVFGSEPVSDTALENNVQDTPQTSTPSITTPTLSVDDTITIAAITPESESTIGQSESDTIIPANTITRDFTEDFYIGLSGSQLSYQPVSSCAALLNQNGPLVPSKTNRANSSALIITSSPDVNQSLATKLADSYYQTLTGSNPSTTENGTLSTLLPELETIYAPAEIATVASTDILQVDFALTRGTTDIAVLSGNRNVSQDAILIGFDMVSAIVHPDNTVQSLSTRDLKAVLTGRIRDWSALDPTRIGALKLYLPPEGSSTLDAVMNFSRIRRANPASAVYIADSAERAAAAAADPNGIAFVSNSYAEAGRTVPIARRRTGTLPSAAAAISGAYTLIDPIYLDISDNSKHAYAPLMTDYALSDAGQAIIENSGLISIKQCSTSNCRLQALGLGKSRNALSKEQLPYPTIISNGNKSGKEDLILSMPSSNDAPSSATLARLQEFLTDKDLAGKAVTIVSEMKRSKNANLIAHQNAESLILALRCVGIPTKSALINKKSKKSRLRIFTE